MLERIKEWINSNRLFESGDTIVAACSGGPDSLALVHILHLLAGQYQIKLAVAHVDHMIRGEQSAADAEFVADFCRAYDLPYYITAINVPQYAQISGRSLEDAAREQRYAYLRRIAADLGGAKIATGHHRDDQAETVLINLLRGAASGGLRGMQPKNGNIIRPLLPVSKRDIEQYCRQYQLTPRLDSTNLETEYVRNKIRLKLLPLLEQEYNPAVKEALFRTAAVISDQHDYITGAALKMWPEIVEQQQDLLLIDTKKLQQQHIALQRELLRLTIEKKQGNLKGITFQHVERLVIMAKNATVGSLAELPGRLLVRKDYNVLQVGWQSRQGKPGIPVIRLNVPGITSLDKLGVLVNAEFLAEYPKERKCNIAVFDWEKIVPPLYVRTRLPGDRFRPLGFNGTKKLKEFFIDAKIPQEERDNIPLICDNNSILWVAGYRQSETGRVTDSTKQFLRLSINNEIY